jgi:hypothetical protein
MRYFEKTFDYNVKPAANAGNGFAAVSAPSYIATANVNEIPWFFKTPKRVQPTIATFNPYAAGTGISSSGSGNYAVAIYCAGNNSVTFRDAAGCPANAPMTLHATASARM